MIDLYIGYVLGYLKMITLGKEVQDFVASHYKCKSINEIRYNLKTDENTRDDYVYLSKDVIQLKEWGIIISHKIMSITYGNLTEIWMENDNGEIVQIQ